jgi:putative flippase GtrA
MAVSRFLRMFVFLALFSLLRVGENVIFLPFLPGCQLSPGLVIERIFALA